MQDGGVEMLVGQDIGLAEVVWISLFGMTVATAAVILLMVFVIILSKIVSGREGAAAQAAVTGRSLENAQVCSDEVSEDEIAAIAASLCIETGMSPDQFRVVSITSR